MNVPISSLDEATRSDLFEYALRLGDDQLVLGHRLSEWCSRAPILEEDIALANIALDCIGQANLLLGLAGELEGKGRDADALAYFRDEIDFRNCLLVEVPRGDFAWTIVRQYLYDAYARRVFERLATVPFTPLAGIAAKALKEVVYHERHAREWLIRLGDGTEESHRRAQRALDDLWRYTGDFGEVDAVEQRLIEKGLAADARQIARAWREEVEASVAEATLALPDGVHVISGGRRGRHTEFLGHMLAEMQILPRSYPDATW